MLLIGSAQLIGRPSIRGGSISLNKRCEVLRYASVTVPRDLGQSWRDAPFSRSTLNSISASFVSRAACCASHKAACKLISRMLLNVTVARMFLFPFIPSSGCHGDGIPRFSLLPVLLINAFRDHQSGSLICRSRRNEWNVCLTFWIFWFVRCLTQFPFTEFCTSRRMFRLEWTSANDAVYFKLSFTQLQDRTVTFI